MHREAIDRYSERLHRAALSQGADHHVVSPVGAWMLLAAACPPSAMERTSTVLGLATPRARTVVAELLDDLPMSCRVALGVWYAPRLATPGLAALAAGDLARAAPAYEFGPLPDKPDLDRWVRGSSFGLFDELPVTLDPLLALLAVSLVATRARWRAPFTVASAASLGSGPFSNRVEGSLRTPPGHDHRVAVVDTVAAGRVGVHQVPDEDGLLVTSVVADSEVELLDVLAAAREVAAGGGSELHPDQLEPGDGPIWSVKEERVAVPRGTGDRLPPEVWAHLPAWSVETDLDLLAEPTLGLTTVADAVLDLLPPHLRANAASRAGQAVRARYHALGFEAAGLSHLAARAGSARQRGRREAVRRHLSIRFGRPYAVVATDTTVAAWRGVPLFSAWIARPDDAAAAPEPTAATPAPV